MLTSQPPKTCPAQLLPLLTSKGSLTALLEKLAGKPLLVRVLSEGFYPLTFSQKRRLNLPTHKPTLAWVRTVALYGDGDRPWVQASSVFPLTSLVGNLKRLRHLKRTPIGYVLFKGHPTLPHLRHYYVNPHPQIDGKPTHYGRQTLYDHQNRLVLIDECFLWENLRQKLAQTQSDYP